MSNYEMIFKRKSFHLFRNMDVLNDVEIEKLKEFIRSVKPLDRSIKTEIVIVPQENITVNRGEEYSILFFSERKGDYLKNIGYIGQQIDLYCTSQNIATLWAGIGKPKNVTIPDMEYVIMISIGKASPDKFRKDMFKSKRKPLEEIWSGDTLGIAEIARFSTYYNKVDIGIFLYILEICLEHEGYNFTAIQYEDNSADNVEKTLVAEYRYSK